MNKYSVPLQQLVEEFNLTVAYRATDFDEIRILVDEVSRPGLPLTGFFEHFEALRMEVLGYVEMTYLDAQSREKRLEIFDRLFAYKIPALVISRGQNPHPECIEMAQKHDITILLGQESTSYIISGLITSLKNALAPRITRHGVLVEVYGEGLFITGESGIGKSETAVELRGIGVINVARLFGVGSIKEETVINQVVNIVPWEPGRHYNRLGLEEDYAELLGVKVPLTTIPVSPGRNLAVILEVAAMNNRQRRLGYNAAIEFSQQIDRQFEQNSAAK